MREKKDPTVTEMLKFIPTSATGIVQTFGKFSGIATPGINFYVPIIQSIAVVSNRVQNKAFHLTVKTKDNVFTSIGIGVQLQIKEGDTEKAFFSLSDPDAQIDSYVQNVVRSKVPTMRLDDLFASQGDIGETVRAALEEKMGDYGYTIVDTLVNEISPERGVQDAMNRINASERLLEAARNEADAKYIHAVREAEADRDRKVLQGEGISGQRLAILKGYEDGVDAFSSKFGLSPQQVVNFVLETQRYDMLEAIGTSQNAKTVFLPSGHGSSAADLSNAIMQAQESK